MSTIALSSIPALTAAVSAPRVAGIEHPLGYQFGVPGDNERQLAILRATLGGLYEMTAPGSVIHLPFEWPESANRLNAKPPQAPPISKYLTKRPWLLPKLLKRELPVSQD